MIRLIRLFAWLEWRQLVSYFRWRRRPDAAERISRLLAVLVPVLLGVLFLGGAVVLSGFAWWGGYEIGAGNPAAVQALFAIKIAVLISLGAMMILVPIGATQQGSAASSARFILLPIPRSRLHLIEVLAGMGNPMTLLLPAALMAIAAGVASAGAVVAGAVALAAGLLVTFIALSFAALCMYASQWIFRDRRRGEMMILLLMLLPLLFSGVAPLLENLEQEVKARKAAAETAKAQAGGHEQGTESGAPGAPAGSEVVKEPFRLWKLLVPSEAYAMALAGGAGESFAKTAAGLAALAFQGSLLLHLSSRVHGILLSEPAAGRRRRLAGRSRALPSIPGLSPAAAAVAATQARTALRTVRGKIAVFFGGAIIIVQGVTYRSIPDAEISLVGFLSDGGSLAAVASLLALLFLQPVMYNQFASDGNGLAMEYLAPLSNRDLVLGKAVGVGILLVIAMIPCIFASAVLTPGGSILRWAAVPFVVLSIYLLTAPLGAFLSMFFPKTADLSKISSAGNAHGFAGLAGFFGTAIAAMPPMAITTMVGGLMEKPLLALGLVALWTILCGLVAWPLLAWVSSLAEERRENLLLVARGR